MLTLAKWVAPGAPQLDRKALFALLVGVAEYVAETHEQGRTLDDLRPPALEVEVSGDAFIVRRARVVEAPAAESPEAVLARSPEQLRDATFSSKQADVYGLGVLMYRLAAGRPPFGGESFHEMLLAIADGAAEPLETLRPELGAQLGALVRRAMSADAALRFRDGGELLRALEEAREAGPEVSPPETEDDAPPEREGAAEAQSRRDERGDESPPEPVSARFALQLTIAFVVVIGVVALGYRKLAPRRSVLPPTSTAALEAARSAASAYREQSAPPAASAP